MAQSPIPNPQSPIPNILFYYLLLILLLNNKIILLYKRNNKIKIKLKWKRTMKIRQICIEKELRQQSNIN
ncbi:MAG: hypothetical protein MJ252_07970 [archaeon]|nr:hypothetical protein [archaeon]